jgi:AmmeMemoRadiSam system protein B/AmmeMemoRadiSam system protein A
MTKRILLCAMVLTLLGSSVSFALFDDVRKPAVAGAFYPGTKAKLSRQIDQFLQKAGDPQVKGKLIALIVPHAGYDYSGQVAAYAYKELKGRGFKRVILMGPSHRLSFDGISIGEFDDYETPLGRVKIDRDFCDKLVKSGEKIGFIREAHLQEHSLEVQLPFLQKTLNKEFKIVPVIFGNLSLSNSQFLAITLAQVMDDETLIVCSTDWSHYHDYKTAVEMDKQGIDAVLNNDVELLVGLLEKGSAEACGVPAVIATMLLAPTLGANEIQLLKYANSGDVLLGDKSKVVGYAAIAYSYESMFLIKEEKQELLKIARKTLEEHLSGNKLPEFRVKKGVLTEKRGAFVTLTKRGRLRGCIGYIQPVKPLAEAVQEMAIAAATKDRRFTPVTKDELPEIEIEISVLSRLEKIKNVDEIKIGRDGLYIIKSWKSGLLLPQVATDNNWGREEFLENVCYKAGLPKDAWKEKDVVLYRFSADVFHE